MKELTALDWKKQNKEIQDSILKSIEKEFPLESNKKILKIENLKLEDTVDGNDFPKIKDIKLKRGTYKTDLYGTASLIDKTTGKVIDKVNKLKIANVPKLTRWYSMLIDGNEYQTVNQLRLKSGIYTRVKDNGDLESRFNLEKGFNFTMILPPERGIIYLVTKNAKYRLYNILYALGVDDSVMQAAWGKEIFDKNKRGALNTEQSDIIQLYKELTKEKEADYVTAVKGLSKYFDSTKVSPDTTKVTLGKSYEKITPETLLDTSKKLINVMKGKESPDERESLIFKDLYSVDDLAVQYFDKNKDSITGKIKYRMDKKDSIREILNSSSYSKPIKNFFTQTDLASTSEQTNPAQIIANAQKVTFMGTGGIGSRHAITKDVRDLHPTHLGFLDPLATPESSRAGVNLGLTRDLVKDGHDMKTPVRMQDGSRKFLSVQEFYNTVVGFGDQYALINKKPVAKAPNVRVIYKGESKTVPAKTVQAWMMSPSNMFSYTTNTIPYMAHDSGNRVAMGTRMVGQAIPIVEREAPYIQTRWKGDESFQKVIGNFMNPAPGPDWSGKVSKIDNNYIHIDLDKPDKKGNTKVKVGLAKNYPLNQESFLNNEVNVKVGDKVTPNKPIADSNFTKDGVLALGANVNVAYMPWKGLTFEDSTVVSESFAKKFTSEKLIKKNIFLSKLDELNLNKFRSIFPDVLSPENAKKLDDSGIIKVGTTVNPGDILAAYISKADMSDEEKILKQMNRAVSKPYKKRILEWDADFPGKVLYVVTKGRYIDIHIKVKSPLVEGDKLCVDEETEILTDNGWKTITNCNLEDKFCTLNPDNHKIEYQYADKINIYYHDGEMYHIKNSLIDQLVTLNHKMYVKLRNKNSYELIPAKKIKNKRVKYLKSGLWEGNQNIVPDSLQNIFNDETYASFLGWYLSKGSYYISKKDCVVTIAQSKEKNKNNYNKIITLLNKCGITPLKEEKFIKFNNKDISLYVKQFGLSHEKFIPENLKNANSRLINIFLKSFSLGNNYTDNTSQLRMITNSLTLRDDLMELFLKAGYSSTYIKNASKDNHINYDIWDVRQIRTKNTPQVNYGRSTQIEEIINYKGKVGCPTTKNGIIYIRRNGKTVWTGNSGLHGNKAIVSEIVPDDQMPHTMAGERMDVIFSPVTVPGRMNIGQIAEAAAGKLIDKTDKKPILIDNFVDKNQLSEIEQKLKENKIPIEETLLDGKDGKPFETPVFWGKPYIMKLRHVVEHKLKSRNIGSYDINLQPSRGKDSGQTMGSMETMAMLSHGAKCFTGNVLVETSEGAVPLWKIFNENKEWFVKSYNKQTNKLEFKKVINKFKSKTFTDNLIKITINNRNTVYCTKGHEFYNINTKKEAANDINEVLIENKDNTSFEQKQVILGSYLGDGYITKSGRVAISHSVKQKKYLKFKTDLLNLKCDHNIKRFGGYKDNSYYSRTKPKSLVFGKFIRQLGYVNGVKTIPKYIYNNLDVLGLSIFYQDAGSYTESQRSKTISLASYNFTKDENEKLKKTIKRITGASFDVRKKENKYYYLVCSRENDRNLFFNSIKKYIHPDMMYKLPKKIRSGITPSIPNNILPLIEAPINKYKYKVSPSQKNIKFKWIYNIEVENNHNYVLSAGYLVGNSNLYEAASIKGQKNDEYWRNLQLGLPTPPPKTNFAFEKMLSYLKQAGINVEKEGDKITLLPLTDKEVSKLSNGKVTDGGQMLVAKNLKTIPGGIFDPEIFGGSSGKKWGHIDLEEKIPNPIMEDAIVKALDITQPKLEAIIEGKETLNGLTGFKAIEKGLSDIDVNKKIKELKKELAAAPEQKVNVINKKIRYLEALNKFNLSPKDYMIKKVPILPPIYRPIYPLPSGDLMVSPINKHYRDVSLINDSIKKIKKTGLDESFNSKNNIILYKSVKALQGLTDPITYTQEKYDGAIKTLAGKSPKYGFIQDRLFSKKQDMSARSTIGLEPSFGLDEVGLPNDMLKNLFKPFVMKKLVQTGMKAVDANKAVNDWTPEADKALDIVINERPVLLNRAPTLHKHGIQAFKAKRVPGKTIKLSPLIVSGFGADFDGNSINAYISISYDISGIVNKDKLNNNFNEIYSYIINKYNLELSNKTINVLSESIASYLDTKKNKIFNIHIKDFPHTKNITKETKKITEYEVPDFIKVFALDDGILKLQTVTKWSIHKNLNMVKVKTSSQREVIVSDDHSLVCYDPITGKVNKSKPAESIGKLTPLPKGFKLDVPKHNKSFNDGWLIGAFVGDGWANRITEKSIKNNCLSRVHLSGVNATTTTRIEPDLANFIRNETGTGAANKHLPRNFLFYGKKYLYGILSGLLDTGGTISLVKTKSKKTPQYQAFYTTISEELHYQLQQLLAALEIRNSITTYRKKSLVYSINISMPDLISIRDNLHLTVEKKQKNLMGASVSKNDKDIVPIPLDLAKFLQKNINRKQNLVPHTQLCKAKKTNSISRQVAKKLCNTEYSHPMYQYWKTNIVLNNNLCWDTIKKVTRDPETTGYDLTVPGPYVFMTSNLLTVQDTMAVHVPVGPDAVNEAWGMLPSKNIFKHGDNSVVPELSQEYQFGLYWLTKEGTDTKKSFNTIKEAEKAGLNETDVFDLSGRKTTIGKELVNSVLPKKFRNYSEPFSKKVVNNILTTIAKEDPNNFSTVINSLKDLGHKYAHKKSSTISLSDFTQPRDYRDKIIKKYNEKVNKVKKDEDKIKLWLEASEKIKQEQDKFYKDKNNVYAWLESGGLSGSKAPNATQILSMPGIVSDVRGKPIKEPILKSFGEGLDAPDYWNTMFGVRKGIIDTAVSTSGPGALSKALMGNVWDTVISEEDCGTKKYLELEVKGNEKDILDRCLARDIPGVGKKNDIIDKTIYNKLKKANIETIKVRSPLMCESLDGICQKCYGILPTGQFPEIGYNVGIADAQAVTEKSTQLALRTKHTGAAFAGGGKKEQNMIGGFERAVQLLEVPEVVPHKAILSPYSGVVESKKRDSLGGWNLKISGKTVNVPSGKKLLVDVGSKVSVGDKLSEGYIKPQELSKLKGHVYAQRQIVDEFDDLYQKDYHKKTFETIIRAVSNNARIDENPEKSDHLRGDTTTIQKIEHENKLRREQGLAPIKYTPYFKSIAVLPQDREDWLSRVGTNRIVQSIKDSAARGAATNIHGNNPIPSYLYGTEFGKKKGSLY